MAKKKAEKKTVPVSSTRTKAKDGWLEVAAGDLHDFEKDGNEVMGVYQGYKTVTVPKQGESRLYTIEGTDQVINFWGSAILDARFDTIKEGAMVRIVFSGRGEKKGKKQAPKLFKVFVKDKKDII